ncbi:MAG TPA: hypothetical protein VFW27_05260 [Actinoplanes sp.]|jgi:hypothetical protein|nr:hypothetical protein [Actinoplanes sp.]
MAADALAALKIWALEVELAGETFTVPARPAADWFLAILDEEAVLPLIPGMMGAEAEDRIGEMLLDEEIDTDLIVTRSRELLTAAAGRPWWEADRLIRSSAASWHIIGGELTRLGVDLEKVSLAAALNAIYVICVRTMDEKERNKFDIDLRLPPIGVEGVKAEDMYDQRAAQDAFAALMGQAMPPEPVRS